MHIDREALAKHLRHIYCDGLLPEFTLKGQFTGVGASLDHQLMVTAGALEKCEPLATDTGIVNLGMFLQILESAEGDKVSLTLEDRWLKVDVADRIYALVTAQPRVISTKVEESSQARVMSLLPKDQKWINLEYRLVKGLLESQRILKAQIITINVTPTGSTIVVGDPKTNVANFPFPEFKGSAVYSLMLSANVVRSVLSQISNFTQAQVLIGGPDGVVALKEGPYFYVISPDEPAEDEKVVQATGNLPSAEPAVPAGA